ncbi:hypothetical protein QOT17_021108 [Balamuthia mandrillaris]
MRKHAKAGWRLVGLTFHSDTVARQVLLRGKNVFPGASILRWWVGPERICPLYPRPDGPVTKSSSSAASPRASHLPYPLPLPLAPAVVRPRKRRRMTPLPPPSMTTESLSVSPPGTCKGGKPRPLKPHSGPAPTTSNSSAFSKRDSSPYPPTLHGPPDEALEAWVSLYGVKSPTYSAVNANLTVMAASGSQFATVTLPVPTSASATSTLLLTELQSPTGTNSSNSPSVP